MASLQTKPFLLPDTRILKRILDAFALLFLLSMASFSAFFLAHGYEPLKNWYLSLNNCFPGQDIWAVNFFTPLVKARGNKLAMIGILFSVIAIVYGIRNRKQLISETSQKINIAASDLGWYGIVACLGVILSIWGWNITAPAYDEIYSAVNCAELHPFQTISYYRLPNNHMYFNLINGVLFGWYSDHVNSGRFISLLAYVGTLLFVFRWLSALIGRPLYAFLVLLPVALQLPVWGFGFQARGYESQLLCGWISFISLFEYLQHEKADTLRINTFFNILGFALLPSYLFWYVAQLVFAGIVILYNKRSFGAYMRCQLLLVVFVFLCYLPAFCFSGIAAFTENRYMKPSDAGLSTFLPSFLSYFRTVINYCFSNVGGENSILNIILFFIPVLLFFTRKKEHKLFGTFYFVFWAVFIAMSVAIQRITFYRVIIVQLSMTMAFVVYTFYVILSLANRSNTLKLAIIGIPILILCGHLLKHDKNDVSQNLYFNDVNALYRMHMNDIRTIPKGSSVAFSYEGFYFFYHCRRLGYDVSHCPKGTEQYYLTRPDEALPAWVTANCVLFRSCEEDYNIYKRK